MKKPQRGDKSQYVREAINRLGLDAKYLDAAKWIKQNDPGRLTALDVWGVLLPRHTSRMYAHIDAIGTTSYFGWYEEPFASAADRARSKSTSLPCSAAEPEAISYIKAAPSRRTGATSCHGSGCSAGAEREL